MFEHGTMSRMELELEILDDLDGLVPAMLAAINRASNQARTAANDARVRDTDAVRELVRAQITADGLPDTWVGLITSRVVASLSRPGKDGRFSNFQGVDIPASLVRWSADNRVQLPTTRGKRTFSVHVDVAATGLRPRLGGKPVRVSHRAGNSYVSGDA